MVFSEGTAEWGSGWRPPIQDSLMCYTYTHRERSAAECHRRLPYVIKIARCPGLGPQRAFPIIFTQSLFYFRYLRRNFSKNPQGRSSRAASRTRQSDDLGAWRWPVLRRLARRRIAQLCVDALGVVVVDIVGQQAPQMLLSKHAGPIVPRSAHASWIGSRGAGHFFLLGMSRRSSGSQTP